LYVEHVRFFQGKVAQQFARDNPPILRNTGQKVRLFCFADASISASSLLVVLPIAETLSPIF